MTKQPWAAWHARASALYRHQPNLLLEKYLRLLQFQADLAVQVQPGPGETLFQRLQSASFATVLCIAVDLARKLGLQAEHCAGHDSLWEYLFSGGQTTEYPRDFIPRLVLQVFATESRFIGQRTMETQASCCPHCGFPALLLALRPEGDGRKRFAVCSLCAAEWPATRIDCFFCGEQRPEQLPLFSFEHVQHIHVQCCNTCQGFLKVVDIASSGLAVPMVDDIATPEVTLWALDQGYRTVTSNLLGI